MCHKVQGGVPVRQDTCADTSVFQHMVTTARAPQKKSEDLCGSGKAELKYIGDQMFEPTMAATHTQATDATLA